MLSITRLTAFVAIAALAKAQTPTSFPKPILCQGPACANPTITTTTPSTTVVAGTTSTTTNTFVINELDYQDMSVIRRNNAANDNDPLYYRFAKANHTGLGLTVATAPALRGPWNYAYEILNPQKTSLLSPIATDPPVLNVWAPEIHYLNQQYYLYYGLNTPPFTFDQCIATSPDMSEGSWTDHGSMGIPEAPQEVPLGETYEIPKYVRLDGSLLAPAGDPHSVTDDRYMVFGSYQFGLYGFQLSSDLLSLQPDSPVREIIIDQYNPAPDAGNKTEGAYLLQHGDYNYLFYSIGQCCASPADGADAVYRVEVCRGPAGSVTGPYVDRNGIDCLTGGYRREGTVVLFSSDDGEVYAPGSPGVINDPVEGLCMYYQYQNNTVQPGPPGLNWGYNYLEFDEEGWPVLVAERPI